jgi:transposase
MAIGYSWFPKGEQRKVPTYGKHQSVKLLGVLDYEKGTIFCAQEACFDAQVFLRFLEKVIEHYPTGKIVLILDNARIHHAKLLRPFLEQQKHRLELLFLPPYSPELNPIEGLWKWMKTSIIYNVFYASLQEIKDCVQTFIDEVNQTPEQVIDRLCVIL